MLRLAFVGMGSIGRRHLLNVCTYLEEQDRCYTIDLYRSGAGGPLSEDVLCKVDQVYPLVCGEEIRKLYDVVFITNPTALHFETIQKFSGCASAMFIEKPVFDQDKVDLGPLNLLAGGIYYVACPLRYHPVLAYVHDHIPCNRVYAARAICSSYLPDWRPGTDYRTCYSAHKELGGGVDIDLIHEWDYLTWLFGPVQEGWSIRDKISHLEINSYDIAAYLARTENTVMEVHLDYFGRRSIRQLQLFLPEETIHCDLLSGTIDFLASGQQLRLNTQRNNYQMEEIQHFFRIFDGKISNDNDLLHAVQVLRYARGDF